MLFEQEIYSIDETMKDKFPIKTTTDVLEDEIDYCQQLIDVVDNKDDFLFKKLNKSRLF